MPTRTPTSASTPDLRAAFVSLLLASCASTQGYYTTGTLQLNPEGQVPHWQVTSGSDVVLVVYTSHSGGQESGANEELVMQLDPAVMAPGTYPLEKAGRVARYQRGGQILTYATTKVGGLLKISRGGGSALAGTVELIASEPTLDLAKLGTLKRNLTFDAPRKSP